MNCIFVNYRVENFWDWVCYEVFKSEREMGEMERLVELDGVDSAAGRRGNGG